VWRGGGVIWRQGKEEVGVEALLRDKHNYYGQGSLWRVQVEIAPNYVPASVIQSKTATSHSFARYKAAGA
jgi:predicted nucleic acid binding AN1-type Zn finger protein